MADTKISALPELITPEDSDLLPIVDDPAGTPLSKRITVANLLKNRGSYQEADRATDLSLSTSFQTAVSLSLGAGTWLVLGQASIESTSTTQGNVNIRLRDTTNSVTYSIAEGEVDSALPDRQSLHVHAVIVLASTATIALEGRQSAGVSHIIGPGNLSDTDTKVTRMTAIRIA